MIKAFFRLWVLVFIPLLLLILPSKLSPITAVNDLAMLNFGVSTYKGIFYLLEQRLNEIPESSWPVEFSKLAEDFVYEIKLLPANEVDNYIEGLRKKSKNEYIYAGDSQTSRLLKKIRNNSWVISITLEETEGQSIVNSSLGPFNLLMADLRRIDKHLWSTRLEELQFYFGYSLQLIDREGISLEENKIKILDAKGVSWLLRENGDVVIYYRIPNEEKILKIGPLLSTEPRFELYAVLLMILFGGISVGILLFVLPLWRDLNKLANSASAFGDGYLDRRAEIGKYSSVARLAKSFNAMANRIESLIEGQRDLTNAIAHDLRTPLSRLSFAFEMLDSGEVSEEDRKRYSQSIASGIDTLDYLIQQVLTLSRYSRAIDITHFNYCKLAHLLDEEVEQHKATDDVLTMELVVDPLLYDSDFFVDQRAMLRALNNLISNAIRYAKSTIRVGLSIEGSHYCLSVEDDGPGIPEEERANVFLPFTQLENQQREISNEHGLGLAIVQQVSIWHKGSVSLSESLLGGACFNVVWPVDRQ